MIAQLLAADALVACLAATQCKLPRQSNQPVQLEINEVTEAASLT